MRILLKDVFLCQQGCADVSSRRLARLSEVIAGIPGGCCLDPSGKYFFKDSLSLKDR